MLKGKINILCQLRWWKKIKIVCFNNRFVMMIVFCCFSVGLLPQPVYAKVPELKWNVQHRKSEWNYELNSQVPLSYHVMALDHPKRLVLDLNTRGTLDAHPVLSLTSPVRAIRHARKSRERLRVVFDLNAQIDLKKIVVMVPAHRNNKLVKKLTVRIPITVTPHLISSSPRVGHKKRHHPAALSVRPLLVKAKVMPKKNIKQKIDVVPARKLVVVIDPGHGGIDPGATGKDNTHEKNIVLSISEKLIKEVNKVPGFKAVLTRRGDYYLKLRQRLDIARHDHADMFVAVHADAFNDVNAHGVSVFALSTRGATSEAAHWLAANENKSESLGGVKLDNKSHALQSILIDLSQKATIATSIRVGEDIIKKIKPYSYLHQNHVEQAAFVVLKSPDIPSLLIEVGFLSNVKEELRLKNLKHQQLVAKAISSGIIEYFKKNAPRHTLLAQWKRNGYMTYSVRPGDTLKNIAAQFQVAEKKIRFMNDASKGNLVVGATLKIPRVG